MLSALKNMHAYALPLAAMSILMLSGCSSAPSKVKDVLEDKFAYLDQNFSAGEMPTNIIDAVTKADNKPIPFKKMVLTVVPEVETQQVSGPKPNYQNIYTYFSAGGALTKVLEEYSDNGIATSQTYSLSYRGFIQLMSQQVFLNSKRANFRLRIKSIDQFPDLISAAAGKQGSVYTYSIGYADPMNLAALTQSFDQKRECVGKGERAAKELYPSLTGRVFDLECQLFNDNGVAIDRTTYTLLADYGISLATHREAANYKTDFKITDVKLE